MPLQFKITITKEILSKSKYCGSDGDIVSIGNNCAIAIALIDIFPQVYVTDYYIFPFGIESGRGKDIKVSLPVIAQQFVKLFDGFRLTPQLRLLLPQFEFTIDLPDEAIEQINIDEVRDLVKGNKTTLSGPALTVLASTVA